MNISPGVSALKADDLKALARLGQGEVCEPFQTFTCVMYIRPYVNRVSTVRGNKRATVDTSIKGGTPWTWTKDYRKSTS